MAAQQSSFFGANKPAYSNNELSMYGGYGGGKKAQDSIDELNAQFLSATNPNKIAATNSDYGLTIATNPYKTQEQIARSQLSTAQAQSGMRLQPMQEKADYGGLRNKVFGQDEAYAGGIVDSGVKQWQRENLASQAEGQIKLIESGQYFNPKMNGGVTYAKGSMDTPEKQQAMINYLKQIAAANRAGMAANPYQYQAPTTPYGGGNKKGYYK